MAKNTAGAAVAKTKTKAKKTSASSKKTPAKKKTAQKKNTSKSTGSKKTKKSTDVRKTEKTDRGRSISSENNGIALRSDITLIVSLALMIIMTISNFGICGPVGNGMSDLFFGVFGCVQYVMPLALFVGVAILIANDYNFLSIKKCVAGFVLLMMISAFAQIIYKGTHVSVTDLMSLAISNHGTGGIIGGSFGLALKACFGNIGAIIIIFFIAVFALIVLTQKSLAEFFKTILLHIQETLKERKERRAELAEKREAELAKKSEDFDDYEDDPEESLYYEGMLENPIEDRNAGDDKNDLTEKKQNTISKLKQKISRKKQKTEEKQPDFDESLRELEEMPEHIDQEDNGLDDIAININIPTFTVADELHKESVRELDENEYPLSAEDSNDPLPPVQAVFDPLDMNVSDPASENFWQAEQQDPMIHAASDNQVEVVEAQNIMEDTSEMTPEEAKRMLNTGNKAVLKNSKNKAAAEGVNQSEPKKKAKKKKKYVFPSVNLLDDYQQSAPPELEKNLKDTAALLQQTLASFGVNVKITDISCGPTVTRYEMFPEQGTKVSKIVNLADDIKLNLAATDIRIEAPIPGKAAIGIEVPNAESTEVHFKDIINNRTFKNYKSKLTFAVGKDIGGKTIVTDVAKMPHLLIAGATGSGKSVCLNTLIMSVLYKATPDDVRMIMIDPKMVELSNYNGIPHLLIPVVTDPKKAAGALNWAVSEMTQRYSKFAEYQVRNIKGYNQKIRDLENMGEIEKGAVEPMPQILIIIDELADLMMVSPGEVEDAIVRLSQLARAAGIHLVIATQRPSVDVITGLIKANVPSRIALSVASAVDSRTILDMQGAEKLLGNGDMLFYPAGYQKPVRVQGAYISDDEIERVVDFIKKNQTADSYDTDIANTIENTIQVQKIAQDRDEYFEDAARFCIQQEKATIGGIQRRFKVGFNRAARIVDQMEAAGIVGPEEGTKPRKVLMSEEQLNQYFEEYL